MQYLLHALAGIGAAVLPRSGARRPLLLLWGLHAVAVAVAVAAVVAGVIAVVGRVRNGWGALDLDWGDGDTFPGKSATAAAATAQGKGELAGALAGGVPTADAGAGVGDVAIILVGTAQGRPAGGVFVI